MAHYYTTHTGCEQETEVDALPGEVVRESEVALREHAAAIDRVGESGAYHVAACIESDVAFAVASKVGVDVYIAHCSTFLKYHVCAVKTAHIDYFVFVVEEFDNLIAVHAIGEAAAPREVAPSLVIADRELETAVAYITGLHIFVAVTFSHGNGAKECLLAGVRLIECQIECERIVEEASCDTGFPRVGAFGIECFGELVGDCFVALRSGVVAIAPSRSDVGADSRTNRSP